MFLGTFFAAALKGETPKPAPPAIDDFENRLTSNEFKDSLAEAMKIAAANKAAKEAKSPKATSPVTLDYALSQSAAPALARLMRRSS